MSCSPKWWLRRWPAGIVWAAACQLTWQGICCLFKWEAIAIATAWAVQGMSKNHAASWTFRLQLLAALS